MDNQVHHYTIDEMIGHFEGVCSWCKAAHRGNGGMNAAVAAELRRLAEYDRKVANGELIYKNEGEAK